MQQRYEQQANGIELTRRTDPCKTFPTEHLSANAKVPPSSSAEGAAGFSEWLAAMLLSVVKRQSQYFQDTWLAHWPRHP